MKNLRLLAMLMAVFSGLSVGLGRTIDVTPAQDNDEKDYTYLSGDGFRFRIPSGETDRRVAELVSFAVPADEPEVFEIPSEINYEGAIYTVNKICGGDPEELYSRLFMIENNQDWIWNAGKLVIPASIEEIEPYTRLADANFREIVVEEGNAAFVSVEGSLLTADEKTLVLYTAMQDINASFIMPATVEECYPGIFMFLNHQVYVSPAMINLPKDIFSYNYVIPYLSDEVETIGESAFAWPVGKHSGYDGTINHKAYFPPRLKRIGRNAMIGGQLDPTNYGPTAGYDPIVIPASLEYIAEGGLGTPPSGKDGAISVRPDCIYFMGSVPPEVESISSMPEWNPNLTDTGEKVKVYVPRDAVAAYQSQIDEGKWSDVNEILPHPDQLMLDPVVGCDGWDTIRKTRLHLSYRLYELGDARMKSAEWVSGNEDIAIFEEDGLLKALKPGVVSVNLIITDNYGNIYRATGKFTVTGDHAPAGTGVDLVEEDGGISPAMKGVWNLQGVKLSDSSENLPAGLYIIDGRKTLIRK